MKTSNIVTDGNYKVRAGMNIQLTNIHDEYDPLETSVEQRLEEIKNFSWYIHSRRPMTRMVADDIVTLLNKLPRLERGAIFFRYGMDLDWNATAEKMNMSRTSTQRLVAKAMEHCKKLLEQEEK